MSSTKQVYKREVDEETGQVKIVKVNKDDIAKKAINNPKNLAEMEQILEQNSSSSSSNNSDNNQEDNNQPAISQATLGNQDAAAVLNPPPSRVVKEKSPIQKEIDTMMAEISQTRFKLMTDAFKDDIILLEFVGKNNKVEQNRISYIPMTMGMGKKVNKIGKQIRLFQADLKGFGKDKKALDVDGLRKKYPEIIDDDMDQEDIMDEVMQNEMVMNYIIKKKCQIYWNINDTDPYPLSDLLVMIGLYESRNGFAPSSTA